MEIEGISSTTKKIQRSVGRIAVKYATLKGLSELEDQISNKIKEAQHIHDCIKQQASTKKTYIEKLVQIDDDIGQDLPN